jgi:hypothetical protein
MADEVGSMDDDADDAENGGRLDTASEHTEAGAQAPRPSACTMSAAIAASAACRRLEVLTRGTNPRGF